jgi:hypothetical protein
MWRIVAATFTKTMFRVSRPFFNPKSGKRMAMRFAKMSYRCRLNISPHPSFCVYFAFLILIQGDRR